VAESAHKGLPRGGLASRRREVRRCLADFGLVRRPLRLWRAPGPDDSGSLATERLAAALQRLGPVFAAFGGYLASRTDLLSPEQRRSLGAVVPSPRPTPPAAVREVLARELSQAPTVAFRRFEEEPCEVGLLFQAHRAQLPDGREVLVKIVHPDREEQVAADLAALSLLKGLLTNEEGAEVSLDGALADFRHAVRQQADFAHEAAMWRTLAEDAEGFKPFCVPRVYTDRSSAGVLTLERLPGQSVADLVSAADDGVDRRDLANRLCTVWLRQALLGRSFSAEPRPQAVAVLPDGRVSFTGMFSSMPSTTRRTLWEYLLAASAGDPDGACGALFRVMDRSTRSVHEDGLRHQFRQAIPSGPRTPGAPGRGGQLGDLVLLHWRLAHAHGCRPSLHLLRFFRGLFLVNETARRLAPERDSLRDGLETVRVMATLGQIRELLGLALVNESLERYAPVLLELPRKMDEVLTLLTSQSARMHLQVRETAEKRRRRNSTAAVTSLLLVLAGVALLARHLGAIDGLGSWGVRIGAGIFVVVGALLLARLSGSR
jgi:predicted unusual protein kinase regulating ubiquinone biosynthesis (AarF/ABC1/UbiB family)